LFIIIGEAAFFFSGDWGGRSMNEFWNASKGRDK
jgi:hypothetical protein